MLIRGVKDFWKLLFPNKGKRVYRVHNISVGLLTYAILKVF